VIRIKDTAGGGSWTPYDIYAGLDFDSGDGSGAGEGVVVRIGASYNQSSGSYSSFNVQTAPTTAGTLLTRMLVGANGDVNLMASDGTTQSFHWDAADQRLGLGITTPYETLHVKSGTNNSSIARFTGAQDTDGLLISTFSSGGNDGGVMFKATTAIGLKTASTEWARLDGNGTLNLYGNNATSLHLNSSSPILSFTDNNSFPDTSDRFEIRGTTADGDAAMAFQFYDDSASSTSVKMIIKDDGKVGIRNSTPESTAVQIGGNPATTRKPSMSIYYPDSGGTDTSLVIRGGSPTLVFDQTGGGNGKILMDSADIVMKTGTLDNEGSEIFRFGASSGNIEFQQGYGVNFGASSGSGQTKTTLSDYEEGTWVPTVRGSTTNGTYTYAENQGSYTKIGRMVMASFNLTNITEGTSGSGVLYIQGLPFDPDFVSGFNINCHGSVSISYFGQSSDYIFPILIDGADFIQIYKANTSDTQTVINITDQTNNAADCRGLVIYQTTA